MIRVVPPGREICGTCEALTSVVCAPARLAMNRCVAGGMARSWLATRYQDGMDFHAGVPEGLPKASSENGLCVANMRLVVLGGRSAAKAVLKPFFVR